MASKLNIYYHYYCDTKYSQLYECFSVFGLMPHTFSQPATVRLLLKHNGVLVQPEVAIVNCFNSDSQLVIHTQFPKGAQHIQALLSANITAVNNDQTKHHHHTNIYKIHSITITLSLDVVLTLLSISLILLLAIAAA